LFSNKVGKTAHLPDTLHYMPARPKKHGGKIASFPQLQRGFSSSMEYLSQKTGDASSNSVSAYLAHITFWPGKANGYKCSP
jgi:hypothetical protein